MPRYKILIPFFLLLILLIAATRAEADFDFTLTKKPAAQVIVKGSKLVDKRTNKEFVPRGVNWMAFLQDCIKEGGFSSGLPTSEKLSDGMIAMAQSWGINTVRLPLNQNCWSGMPGQSDVDSGLYRNSVEDFVNRLNKAGISVILVLQHGVGSSGRAGMKITLEEKSILFWTSIAKRFKNNKSVMFELFNEPQSVWDSEKQEWFYQLSWDCWANGGCLFPDKAFSEPISEDIPFIKAVGMREVIREIRAVGDSHPLIINGIDYSNNLTQWSKYMPTKDKQLIAGFHAYIDQRCNYPKCWEEAQRLASKNIQRPLLITETGQEDCKVDYFNKILTWADKARVGYLIWLWNSPDKNPDSCKLFNILSDWKGGVVEPGGVFYREHLKNWFIQEEVRDEMLRREAIKRKIAAERAKKKKEIIERRKLVKKQKRCRKQIRAMKKACSAKRKTSCYKTKIFKRRACR